ncbi:MAG: hypothetical protein ACXABG_05340 [Promethearchaeota archaeon]
MKSIYFFSGYVKSTSYEVITDALVEIYTEKLNPDKKPNGTTTTDKKGYFKIKIETNTRNPRFVLNISQEGYGLFSKVFFRGKQNGIWLLTKGTIHKIDPTKNNTIRDTPQVTKFTGPLSRHIDLSKITSRRLLRADKIKIIENLLQSTQHYLDPNVIKEIQNKGIEVTIMADTLVNLDTGRPPVGPVNVTLATVDILGPDSMPGDYTATFKDKDGNDQIGYMITYGAGSVDVFANGEEYTLKEGSTAKITIPLPKHLEGSKSIPKTIPFLEYDKEKGIWEAIGEGTFDENTQVYTATSTQFSSFNMDILKTDQACLVIDGTGIKKDYKLQIDFTYNGNSTPRTVYPNANEIYALYNIPPDIEYTLTAFKIDPVEIIEIDSAICTPDQQDPGPNRPDPGTDFEFPACHHKPSCQKPVELLANPPDHPTALNAEYEGCNYVDLLFTGNAIGEDEGYIIKVYQYEGDPAAGNAPLFEYTASYQDVRFRVEGRERIDGTMEGLEPSTDYYIHIHQYDNYASEDSEPWPTSPLYVRTSDPQTFSIRNEICDQNITRVRFNDRPEDQTLPAGGIGYNSTEPFSICQRPDSIQVETALITDPSTIFYSFDFRNNSVDSITVQALVEILVGNDWKGDNIPPERSRLLVFQPNGSFILYDGSTTSASQKDNGEYWETGQECGLGIIHFRMKFFVLETTLNCEYHYPTDSEPHKIIILSYPTIPGVDAIFIIEP